MPELSGSEAINGFVGWLARRKKRTVISNTDEVGPLIDLMGRFCNANKLSKTRPDWQVNLVHPEGD